VEGDLLLQLSDFLDYRRGGLFDTMIDKTQKMEAKLAGGKVDPRAVWHLFQDLDLAKIAIAILSVPASEASVERSFSLQGAVHIDDSTVESEMFLRSNTQRSTHCSEMDDDYDAEGHAEAFTLWVEAEKMIDQPVPMELDADVEPAAAAAAPSVPRRTDSMVINRNYQFRNDWIEAENITMEYSWSKTQKLKLETALLLQNLGGWTTMEMVKQIKEEVKRRALGEMQA
jgi:hypothetical protein